MVSVKVLFEYDAQHDDELDLKVGDIVENVTKEDEGWWEGELDGKRGMFPENFVEEIPGSSDVAPQSSGAYKYKAKVTFNYEPEQDDELELEVGDLVEVLEDEEGGWWKGRLKGKSGMFPSNFVEVIKESEKLASKSKIDQLVPESSNKERPKSQIGFALSPEDLLKSKLKKTGNAPPPLPSSDEKPKGGGHMLPEPLKPVQTVNPWDKASEPLKETPVEKKLPTPPTPAVTTVVEKARVIFQYEPEQDDELKLNVGDIIVITNKDVFEGWLQGELNGKRGLFPDNFVELLPPETIKVEPSDESANKILPQKSIKRAAKENPTPEPAPEKEKSKPMGTSLFPGGVNPLKQELAKKFGSLGKGPPPKIEAKKPSLKGPVPPPPSSKPKPLGNKPTAPLPQKPVSSHASASSQPMNPLLSTKPFGAIPAAATPTSTAASLSSNLASSLTNLNKTEKQDSLPRTLTGSSLFKNKAEEKKDELDVKPVVNGDVKKEEPSPPSVDFDAIEPTTNLKHMTRPKGPGKNLPTKFKDTRNNDGEVKLQGEVNELKTQVNELQTRMTEMERKFKTLLSQVESDLDTEKTARLSQQVEIERLNKRIALLLDK